MKFFRRDERGVVVSAAAITLLSIALGGGAAAAAVFTVIQSQGPGDSSAVQTRQSRPCARSAVKPPPTNAASGTCSRSVASCGGSSRVSATVTRAPWRAQASK